MLEDPKRTAFAVAEGITMAVLLLAGTAAMLTSGKAVVQQGHRRRGMSIIASATPQTKTRRRTEVRMLQNDSAPTWRLATSHGVQSILTDDAITTRRHGLVGERPCIVFCCQLERSGPDGSGCTAEPPPPPSVLYLRSTLGGRTFWFERCSTAAWDALPPAQREARLAVEQRSWPGATAASHRHASCFEATTLREGSDPSRPRLQLRFPFYACSAGLKGGLLEVSLMPLTEGEQVFHTEASPSVEGRHFGVWAT